jgi:hypothetical protein
MSETEARRRTWTDSAGVEWRVTEANNLEGRFGRAGKWCDCNVWNVTPERVLGWADLLAHRTWTDPETGTCYRVTDGMLEYAVTWKPLPGTTAKTRALADLLDNAKEDV